MRLPESIYSHLGSVPVVMGENLEHDGSSAFGLFDIGNRGIMVDRTLGHEAQLVTFYHEMLEIALHDSGMNNLLPYRTKELICDAVGLYLASATLAGFLTPAVPDAVR